MVELKKCDAIYMLSDWKESEGAQAEFHFAKAIGKRIFFAERTHAENYLMERWLTIPGNENKRLSRSTVKEYQKYINEHIKEAWLEI